MQAAVLESRNVSTSSINASSSARNVSTSSINACSSLRHVMYLAEVEMHVRVIDIEPAVIAMHVAVIQ